MIGTYSVLGTWLTQANNLKTELASASGQNTNGFLRREGKCLRGGGESVDQYAFQSVQIEDLRKRRNYRAKHAWQKQRDH